ncbi:hypothetical protein SDC9_210988 [bioreactor metagenome]|uniref:Uncharacterized protein n=1 Tax=bioreactor metagenome TaxID=1076179 RepID=A0A645JHY4_9ZZZZ
MIGSQHFEGGHPAAVWILERPGDHRFGRFCGIPLSLKHRVHAITNFRFTLLVGKTFETDQSGTKGQVANHDQPVGVPIEAFWIGLFHFFELHRNSSFNNVGNDGARYLNPQLCLEEIGVFQIQA